MNELLTASGMRLTVYLVLPIVAIFVAPYRDGPNGFLMFIMIVLCCIGGKLEGLK